MSKRQARNITKTYAKALTKDKFSFERMYLFGSQANGKAGELSDIDIAVVSRRPGRGKRYLSQKMKLWKAAVDVDTRIEPVLLSIEDIEESTASIIGDEVRKYGIRVV